MKYFKKLLCCFVLLNVCVQFSFCSAAENDPPKAKNVIYLVADGSGFNSFLAGAYWKSGEAGKQATDKFPVLMGMSTYSIKRDVDPFDDHSMGYDPEKVWSDDGMGFRTNTDKTTVTDSSAAGTALFTGQKTINNRVSSNAEREPIKLLAEHAADRGLSSGVVTSIYISHATPATFGAHHRTRGELPQIFNYMFDKGPLSVLMGTGHPMYRQGNPIKFGGKDKDGKEIKPNYQYLGGEGTWNRLQNADPDANYAFFDKTDDFLRLTQANISIPEKVVAIAREYGTLIPKDGANPGGPEAIDTLKKRFPNADFDEFPTLTEMSMAAITLLSRNTKGFVLMIEGGVIDGANHRRDIELSVWESTAFYNTIDAVCEWVEDFSSWDETLVIVTADHETGDIWGPGTYEDKNNDRILDKGETFYGYKKIVNNGKGKLPGVQYAYGSHSNQLVPFWAKGPGAEQFEKRVRGVDKKAAEHYSELKTPANNFHGQYIDNTDIVPTLLEIMVK